MKFVLATAAAAAVGTQAMSVHDSSVALFHKFKSQYNKVYSSSQEEMRRFEAFRDNVEYINTHNMKSDQHGFKLAINHFADMTNAEYREQLTVSPAFVESRVKGSTYLPATNSHPDTVNWVNEGYVNKIKDQASCGSCWAFSAVAAIEGQVFKKTGNLHSYAEQELVDCSGAEGNMGCNGGLPDYAFTYVKGKGTAGLNNETEYPYHAVNQQCNAVTSEHEGQVTGHVDVTPNSEEDLTSAIAENGPISICIDAAHQSFQFYSSGVYFEPSCSSTQFDHAVAAVGYGSENGSDYYLVRNSWGTVWGDQGYIKMSRGKDNNCAVATLASYPLV